LIEIIPVSRARFQPITVPGSKSLTNRALLLGTLARGDTILNNVSHSDDSRYMMEALRMIGVRISEIEHTVVLVGGKSFHNPGRTLSIGNAGTAMRFLGALAPFIPGEIVLDGDPRMRERPIGDLVLALRQLGADISYLGNIGFPPIRVMGSKLHGGSVHIRADVSSQYLSALLMVAPYIGEPVSIHVDGPMVSRPYIDMTLRLMRAFGVTVKNDDYVTFSINPGTYTAQAYAVEGDASSAAYYWAMSFLHGTPLPVINVPDHSLQGDSVCSRLLESLKTEIPSEIDMNDMPDCVQTLAVVLATIPKKTCIKNVFNLRVKETDRLSALSTELRKIGVKVEEGDDFICITGSKKLSGATIATFGDHRMAMSFAILGTKVPGIRIDNHQCVSKSYPHFWDDLKSLGVGIKIISP
jgi:3-phosphoshikimate 1-carboxyvinyltransferase